MVGVGIVLLQRIIIIGVEIGGMGDDIAAVGIGTVVLEEAIVCLRSISICISAPYLHATRHHDRPQAHVLVSHVGGTGGIILERCVGTFEAAAVGELHDDACRRVGVFVSSGGIEHGLQLGRAGRVAGRGSRGEAVAFGRNVEDGLSAHRFRVGRNAVGVVILVSTLVHGAVLHTVGSYDVFGDVLGRKHVFLRTLVDTLRGGGLQRVCGGAIRCTHERLVGLAGVVEGLICAGCG